MTAAKRSRPTGNGVTSKSVGGAENKGSARPDRFGAAVQTALSPLRCVVCGVARPKFAGLALDFYDDGHVVPRPVCTACMATGGER